MKNQFDELAKGLAQSVTRRAALKKFGVGLAGMALAVLGFAPRAEAGSRNEGAPCTSDSQCRTGLTCIYGSCQPLSGPGGICENDKDCRRGLVCRPSFGAIFNVCTSR